MAKAWGIDIGSTSIKAVLMSSTSTGICKIEEFDEIPITPSPDPFVRKQELHDALNTLTTSRHCHFGRTPVYVTLSNNILLLRNFQLPPGYEDKLDDLVLYEAKQQIPFPLDQVEWSYTMEHKDTVVCVTLFAARKQDVADLVASLQARKLNVQGVVPSGLALCNFIQHETGEGGPALILNAGHSGIDFVAWNKEGVYIRRISIGGEAVTKAIASSPNSDKILEAIAPTLKQIEGEIARAFSFYRAKDLQPIQRCYAMGHLFQIPGVTESMQRCFDTAKAQPGVPFSLVKDIQKIQLDYSINAGVWQECFPVMGPAIGAALQGNKQNKMSVNLWKPAQRKINIGLLGLVAGVVLIFCIGALVILNTDSPAEETRPKRDLPPRVIVAKKKTGDVPKKVVDEVKRQTSSDLVRESIGSDLEISGKTEAFVLRDKVSGRRFLVIRSTVTGDACVALIPETPNIPEK